MVHPDCLGVAVRTALLCPPLVYGKNYTGNQTTRSVRLIWQAWLTVAVTAAIVLVLARGLVAPSSAMIGGVAILMAAGVLDGSSAFAGLANPAVITVGALYVVGRAIEKTGALYPLVVTALGDGERPRATLARLVIPSAAAAAFCNNTPVVAMLVPAITRWADRTGRSASTLLMPLSFAAHLGGVLTLVGTSTILVVSGLLQSSGLRPFGMFEPSRLGLPAAAVGLIVLIVTAPWLLPTRRGINPTLVERLREFSVQMRVVEGGQLDNKSVEAAGLRQLQGVYLVEIVRGGEVIAPVSPATKLRGGDLLTFAGRSSLIVDLQAMRGLVSSEAKHVAEIAAGTHGYFEVVIGAASPLVGRTARAAGFRAAYQAAVVAIHRAGERVDARLGDVELRAGDMLLVLSDTGFRDRWRDRHDFLLISLVGGVPHAATRSAWAVGAVIVFMATAVATSAVPMIVAAVGAAGLLVFTGVLTATEARTAVDLDVVLVIAGGIGLGEAFEKAGLAAQIAHSLVSAGPSLGVAGTLIGLLIATVILTELVTNKAAVAILFPIAVAAAREWNADPRMFALAIAVMASSSFLTPIGYQTNTMVYGPGGYRFGDYARLGLPLTLVVMACIVSVLT